MELKGWIRYCKDVSALLYFEPLFKLRVCVLSLPRLYAQKCVTSALKKIKISNLLQDNADVHQKRPRFPLLDKHILKQFFTKYNLLNLTCF